MGSGGGDVVWGEGEGGGDFSFFAFSFFLLQVLKGKNLSCLRHWILIPSSLRLNNMPIFWENYYHLSIQSQ